MSLNWEDTLHHVDIQRVNAELAYLEEMEREKEARSTAVTVVIAIGSLALCWAVVGGIVYLVAKGLKSL